MINLCKCVYTHKHKFIDVFRTEATVRELRRARRDVPVCDRLAVAEFPFPSLERRQLPAQGQGYSLYYDIPAVSPLSLKQRIS